MGSSEEVQAAIGATPDAAGGGIAQLERELSAPSESELKAQRLARLKAEREAKRAAQLKTVAERRRLGIKRALGSVTDQLDQDEQRYVAAVKAVVAAAATFNARIEQHEALRAEDAALADHFGLPASDLVLAVAAGQREAVVAARRTLWEDAIVEHPRLVRPQVEQDETGMRHRRNYGEIAGSPGHA